MMSTQSSLANKEKTMRYSVDAISVYLPKRVHKKTGKFVIIKRLSFPCGLAFPGGGIEEGEERKKAVVREMKEETNLDFTCLEWMPKQYDEKGRDPRWPATSYIATGYAEGWPVGEKNKTEVLFLSLEEMIMRKNEFVFDHYKIFMDYMSSFM